MKINKSILLIDPRSIFHKAPKELILQDEEISKRYNTTLNKLINAQINIYGDNLNAISSKYLTNYGLLMLATELENLNLKVYYINGDYYANESDFFDDVILKVDKCCGICCTATTPQYPEIVKLVKKLKDMHPEKFFALGGPHTYFYQNHFEKNPFDIIIIGHNVQKSAKKIFSYIQSVGTRGGQQIIQTFGYVDSNKNFKLIPNDKIPFTLLYSYATFGCPNNCSYCVEHIFTNSICYSSIKKKVDEIVYLVTEMNIHSVHLADSDFFININYTKHFLNELNKRKIKACYTINTSPKSLNNPQILTIIGDFKKLGLIEILIGVEYFSIDVLNKVNKYYSIELFASCLTRIKKMYPEIIISFYSLIGLPGENQMTRIENCNWFKYFFRNQLVDFSFPKIMVPYPGSDIFENTDKYNAKILHQRWSEYHRWSINRPIEYKNQMNTHVLEQLKELYDICSNII